MTETRDLASSSDDGDATSTGPLVHWSIPPHSSGVINHHPVSAKARRVESWLGACSLRCSDPLSLELGSVPMAKTILQCWEASIGCSWLFIEHIYIYTYIYIYTLYTVYICIWSPHPPEPTLSIDHGKHSPARIPGPLHWVTCTWRCLRRWLLEEVPVSCQRQRQKKSGKTVLKI